MTFPKDTGLYIPGCRSDNYDTTWQRRMHLLFDSVGRVWPAFQSRWRQHRGTKVLPIHLLFFVLEAIFRRIPPLKKMLDPTIRAQLVFLVLGSPRGQEPTCLLCESVCPFLNAARVLPGSCSLRNSGDNRHQNDERCECIGVDVIPGVRLLMVGLAAPVPALPILPRRIAKR